MQVFQLISQKWWHVGFSAAVLLYVKRNVLLDFAVGLWPLLSFSPWERLQVKLIRGKLSSWLNGMRGWCWCWWWLLRELLKKKKNAAFIPACESVLQHHWLTDSGMRGSATLRCWVLQLLPHSVIHIVAHDVCITSTHSFFSFLSFLSRHSASVEMVNVTQLRSYLVSRYSKSRRRTYCLIYIYRFTGQLFYTVDRKSLRTPAGSSGVKNVTMISPNLSHYHKCAHRFDIWACDYEQKWSYSITLKCSNVINVFQCNCHKPVISDVTLIYPK